MLNQMREPNNSKIGFSIILNLKVARFLSLVILLAGAIFSVALLNPISARAAAAGVTLSATPGVKTVNAGQSAVYTINLNRNNFTGNVTLSASNLPAGATVSFSPNPASGKSSVLTVTTTAATPAGSYQPKISGSAAGISIAAINVTLNVQKALGVELTAFPEMASIIAGQSASIEINLARTNYDGAVILAAENLPEGVSATFDENPVYGPKTTMRIYSHGVPHVWKDGFMSIRATLRDLDGRFALLPFRLAINCGIDWVEQYGTNLTDARNNDLDRNGDVTVDGSGNIFTVANTFGTIDPQNPNQGATDIWLAKYTNTGQRAWVKQLGSSEEDWVTEVVVDSAGSIFVGGYTAGDMPGNMKLGNFDFFIAKYDANGVFQWVKQGGTAGQDGKFGLAIVPDGAGGGRVVTFTSDRTRIRTYTFDVGGNLSVQSNFAHIFPNTPYDLAIGPNNTIYVVGTFTDINGAVTEFVVKYDAQGNEVWRNTFGSPHRKKATRIALDSAGNAYVAGRIEPPLPAVPHPKAWIAKYDAGTGVSLWTKYEPSEIFNLNNDVISAVGIDSNGDVVIAGMTQGVLGESNGNGTIPGVDDAWVSRRQSSTGDLVWVKQFPVADIDGFDALAFDNNKGIILAGYTVAFKNNIGYEDALLMRYADSTSGTPVRLLPYITNLSPANGPVGNTIRINGVNFLGITGVRFNGLPAIYTVVSLTQIDAVVPTGATSGLITISRGCESFSSPAPFTVVP